MAVDGPPRPDVTPSRNNRDVKLLEQQGGFLAGSKALDSLDKLITSTESFFHPSNSGSWTAGVRL
jgi:proteasome activator subunit 4